MSSHQNEINEGLRFRFGENWLNFLAILDEDRIARAEASLRESLSIDDLKGKTFLDAGSGSGLFSLAARRLGADVISFDFDPTSIECTAELKRRYFPDDGKWEVFEGSILDSDFLGQLPPADVVYSWGVLHHTGQLWAALDGAQQKAKPGGLMFIALYNDQGTSSIIWKRIKVIYNRLPRILRGVFIALVILPFELFAFMSNLLRFRPMRYIRSWRAERGTRGMNKWHDWVDWVGGLPFEVSSPDDIVEFFRKRDFTLTKIRTVNGWGNNEYVFKKAGGDDDSS